MKKLITIHQVRSFIIEVPDGDSAQLSDTIARIEHGAHAQTELAALGYEPLPHRNDIEASVSQVCRICNCTDNDCSGCIERTGEACEWTEEDLCSACAGAQCGCGNPGVAFTYVTRLGDDGEAHRSPLIPLCADCVSKFVPHL